MEEALRDRGVAIVCAHFSPEVGYQEVDLARAFTRMGARVRVVTSTRRSPNARAVVHRDYTPGLHYLDGYQVVRLNPRLTIGPNVLGCKVSAPVSEFEPDFVILVGPGKLFGLELFSSAKSPWRRIAVVQDNSDDGRARNAVRRGGRWRAFAHRLVKRPAYRRVVRNADRIVLNVPETRELIDEWLHEREREQLRDKGLELPLGFDPDRFFFDDGERGDWRSAHGIGENEVVLTTCTRAVPGKRLEEIIDVISDLHENGLSLRYAVAGLLDDDYAERLKAHARAQADPEAYLLLPALTHEEMRKLFCASDLGYWPRPAITIQQAMGTGLPVVLHDRPNVSGLLEPDRNGWYVRADESLEEAFARAAGTLAHTKVTGNVTNRKTTAAENRAYLSYDVIARQMVDGLSSRRS